MKKKLLIFDLDGTLLDTIDDLYLSINATLSHFGYPTRTREEVISFVGNGYIPLLTRALPKSVCEEHFDEIMQYFKTYYAEHCHQETKPFDGIEDLLDQLRENGALLAVLSNKGDAQVKTLVEHYFGQVFYIVAGERVGIRKKPFPDSVEEILKQTGIAHEDAVYIGDSEVDVQTAIAANIDCVCVDWGFRTREQLQQAGANIIVSSMQDLRRALLQ